MVIPFVFYLLYKSTVSMTVSFVFWIFDCIKVTAQETSDTSDFTVECSVIDEMSNTIEIETVPFKVISVEFEFENTSENCTQKSTTALQAVHQGTKALRALLAVTRSETSSSSQISSGCFQSVHSNRYYRTILRMAIQSFRVLRATLQVALRTASPALRITIRTALQSAFKTTLQSLRFLRRL